MSLVSTATSDIVRTMTSNLVRKSNFMLIVYLIAPLFLKCFTISLLLIMQPRTARIAVTARLKRTYFGSV